MRTLLEFELIDFDNNKLNNSYFSGKWSLLFFGYMHCPDVCPQAMHTLSAALDHIEADAGKDSVQIFFVSVDPERDIPSKLKEYVSYFDKRFIGATAQQSRLEEFSGAIGASYAKSNNSNTPDYYLMQHSAEIFVINPSVELYAMMPPPYSANQIADDIKVLFTTFSASEHIDRSG